MVIPTKLSDIILDAAFTEGMDVRIVPTSNGYQSLMILANPYHNLPFDFQYLCSKITYTVKNNSDLFDCWMRMAFYFKIEGHRMYFNNISVEEQK